MADMGLPDRVTTRIRHVPTARWIRQVQEMGAAIKRVEAMVPAGLSKTYIRKGAS